MKYNPCGSTGLRLPQLSFGLWHSFDAETDEATSFELLKTAFELGITHLDTANVYGPPNGHAEERLGRLLKKRFPGRRDELVIATKAGYRMWDGPDGEGTSRTHILRCAEQSLRRLGMDYVDIFYSHRPDPDTPFEETAEALCELVRSGKALHIGISNYNGEQTAAMARALESEGIPLTIHQVENSMLVPFKAVDFMPALESCGAGAIVFAPLAGGRLSEKYLQGIPDDSRAARNFYLKKESITNGMVELVIELHALAEQRGQTLPQMALTWALKDRPTCSALIGASRPEQIRQNCQVLEQPELSAEEGREIDRLLARYHGIPPGTFSGA